MTKKYLFTEIAMLLLILGFTASNVFSNPAQMPCQKKCQYSKMECQEHCLKGLDDAQKEKMVNLRQTYLNDIKALVTSSDDKIKSLREELAKPDTDRKKARKLQKEISSIDAKIEMRKIDFILDVKKINPAFNCPHAAGAYCMANPQKAAPACTRPTTEKNAEKKCPYSKKVY